MSFVHVVFALQTILSSTNAYPVEDEIKELPSYGPPPTTQYSGYLDATKGCDVDANGECRLHYWFASADSDPSTAPTVVWTNGGPGASGLLGFFEELGPLLIDAKGGLMENPWSWTSAANLLVLEAPVGVGFSYCDNMKHGKPCKSTDRTTASASRAALQDFFENKFPELSKNDLYLTGESYAGVYVPTLAKEILDNTDLPLTGVAVGDPCTDDDAQGQSMDPLWYAYKYGLMDNDDYEFLQKHCGSDVSYNLMPLKGFNVINDFNTELLEIENLEERRVRANELFDMVVMNGAKHKLKMKNWSKECTVAYRKFLISASNGLSQSWSHLYIDDYSLFTPVSTEQHELMYKYLNREDVRKALHVNDAPVKRWYMIGQRESFKYKKEYKACNWSQHGTIVDKSMVDVYKEIVPKLSRTWIYNGDTDPCVSYEGTRTAVKKIGFDELEGGAYRPWFYDQSSVPLRLLEEKAATFGPNLNYQDMGVQFGGEVVDFEEGLVFVTFHGSGHMVPQYRPQAALHFLNVFLDSERRLSPLLPSDDNIAKLSNSAFEKLILNKWTVKATSRTYAED